jgi:glycosyltransferase involved in cell wall biosynthesis
LYIGILSKTILAINADQMGINIIHVVEPFAGGTVTFLKSLTDNLQSDSHIIIHGERREVMCSEDVKAYFSSNSSVRFIRWRSAQRSISLQKDFGAFMELYTILKRLKSKNLADTVHLHSSKSGFIGRIVCKLLGIKNVIYTPNGAPFLVGTNTISNYLYKQLERLGARFGGRVVCCSTSEQEAYKKAGINALIINNGIEISESNASSAVKKNGNVFRVITSGRIQHQKNPALFNSIAQYFEGMPQFKFLWAGDGPDRHLLTANNIQVSGWLAKEDLQAVKNEADVFLSTSNFEGLSFSVLEALTMKKPVLLSDCTGNRDLVQRHLNGDLFRNKNDAAIKLLQYFNNSSMLRVMGEHSYRYCTESFNVEDTYKGYRKLYTEGTLFGFNQFKTSF